MISFSALLTVRRLPLTQYFGFRADVRRLLLPNRRRLQVFDRGSGFGGDGSRRRGRRVAVEMFEGAGEQQDRQAVLAPAVRRVAAREVLARAPVIRDFVGRLAVVANGGGVVPAKLDATGPHDADRPLNAGVQFRVLGGELVAGQHEVVDLLGGQFGCFHRLFLSETV